MLADLKIRRLKPIESSSAASYQRQGVGRQLMVAVLEAARAQGILSTFVPADNDDGHALDFYRSVGGSEQAVTFFNF